MRHRHETEIKLEVLNPRRIKRRLKELGFRTVKARHFESNYLFDFPDLALRKAGCLLRVRYVDRHGVLTFKGAPLRAQEYKIRREIESAVADGHQVREIITCLGLHEVFRYEKYRTVYSPPGKHDASNAPNLVYDETPIGKFVELEGSRRWIDEVADQLGYARTDYITASYGTLYCRWCEIHEREPGNLVFADHKS
jgi:adenylate cyclase, class 2